MPLQLLTKVGALNVPEWYDAGKVAIDNSFAPFGKAGQACRAVS